MNRKQYIFILWIIICVSVVFRFWNYSGRFGLAYDQAHDALVARAAVDGHLVPLVGPFSSAGPFQTSGTWYWLLMLPIFFFQSSVISPWIFLTVLSVGLVAGMAWIGTYLAGMEAGLIAAALTAVSTAQIAQSVNMTNQTPIPFASFAVMVAAVYFIKKGNMKYAFFMGFFAGMAVSIHLQGMALGIVVCTALIFRYKTFVKSVFSATVGFILPSIPLLLWDQQHDFRNLRNMVYYYRVDQFNVSLDVLGRRWLTYITDFWPREWSHISGGLPGIGIVIAVCFGLLFLRSVYKKSLQKEWWVICISFFCMVVLVRYTHVPIFSSFITFMHPFVLILTMWTVVSLMRINRTAGVLIFLLIIGGSIRKSAVEAFAPRQNWTADISKDIRLELSRLFPGEKFSVYDFKYEEVRRSVPLVLYLDEAGLISTEGRKIGFLRLSHQSLLHADIISTQSGLIADLSSSGSATLLRDGWQRVNPRDIYHSTEDWLLTSE